MQRVIRTVSIICALFLNMKGIYENKVTGSNIFTNHIIVIGTISIIIFILYRKNWTEKSKLSEKILAILFSLFTVIGNSYLEIASWNLVFGSFRIFFLAILQMLGYFFLYQQGLILLRKIIKNNNLKPLNPQNQKLKKWLIIWEKHPFLYSLIVIIMMWLVYIIAFYPIILSPDPSFQIKQYFNEYTKYIEWVIPRDNTIHMTTHHPTIHTFLLGGCIQLGSKIIDDNFGLFIYSILQTLCLASALAYSIFFLKKHQVSNKYRLVLLGIYSLVPMFPLYAMSAVKDTYYTAFMILYVLALFDIVKTYNFKKIPWQYLAYIGLLMTLISLFRNNGFYVIILSFPWLILSYKKNRWPFLLTFICFFTIYQSYNKVLIPKLGISDGSIREVLSIPFQQTARYVKEYETEITQEQQKIINNMLGYSDLKDRYDPEKADPVKNMYNKDITSNELKDYFTKVWLVGLINHPTTYIQATLNNIYGYFNPNSTNWYVYYKYDDRITQNNLVDYHYNSLSSLRNILSSYGVSFPYIPVIGLISNIGVNTWSLLIMSTYLITNRKKEYLITLSPLLLSVLVCIASPVNTYFRYAMPYIFIMPTLIGLIVKELKQFTD
ncbi:MAG: DUF6020 family protein [bacterium]|nr:DUF6020 family protein [bacterium]